MDITFPYTIRVKLPGDLEAIPSVRKFISEALRVSGFSAKFAFRAEIIVDGVCNNAITYGNDLDAESEIEVVCRLHSDRMEIAVKDRGGAAHHIERLKEAVGSQESSLADIDYRSVGLGLEIVRLLSETMELTVDDNNLTLVHVVRKREDVQAS